MRMIVRCPKCKQSQTYRPRNMSKWQLKLSNKFKICVFCGHSIRVYNNLKDNNVVKHDSNYCEIIKEKPKR